MLTMLVDGTNLFYRAYHIAKKGTAKEQKTGGAVQTIEMLSRLISHAGPRRVIVAWDLGECTVRKNIYPEYKAGRRSEMDEEELQLIKRQMEMCQEMLGYLNVMSIRIAGTEADDVIGYLAQKLPEKKVIVSNDRDFIQLIDEDVSLMRPQTNEVINHRNIKETVGFPAQYHVLYKSLVGDSSDNVKGIPRIGEKTAKKIIVEGLQSGKIMLKSSWKETLLLNKKLMTIGALITDDIRAEIRSEVRAQKNKKINNVHLKAYLIKIGCRSLAEVKYSQFISPFKTLKS